MEVQRPYLDRILADYPEAELHLWDLTRSAADARYLDTLEGSHEGRVRVLRHLHSGHPIRCRYPTEIKRPRGWPPCTCIRHKPPYEEPYKFYANDASYAGTTFVKMDDDVLFLETKKFAHLIDPLIKQPERIISASVINNAVCAKYNVWNWANTANLFALGTPSEPKNDKRWWALHTSANFARAEHQWFLTTFEQAVFADAKPYYVRTRPGEAVSINCIAFTHQTMRKLAGMMNDRLGDEGAVDRLLPWIALSFRAAHLTFGPQDKEMSPGELEDLRTQYAQLAKEYLA